MRYHPLHCWDCGVRVIGGEQGNHTALPNFRQVRFGLADKSYCESPFCETCATRPWTSTRALEFEQAVNAVDPRHQIHVLSVEGVSVLREPILAIIEPAPGVRI